MAARRTPRSQNEEVPESRALARVDKSLVPAGAINAEWKQRLAKYAQRDAATATGAGGWGYIGTKNGVFKFNDTNLEELPPMLILGASFENAFYEGAFDPDNPSSPKCFALAREEKLLAPPESLGDKRQSLQSDPAADTCAGCWANSFGSAVQGRGKACKNIRRLALLPADRLDARALQEVEGAMLRLPVTSIKNYSSFANKVTKGIGVPLFMMRVRISIEPDTKSQFKITFEPYDFQKTANGSVPLLIQNSEILTVLEQRVNEADTYLDQLPNSNNDEAEAPKGRSAPKGRATTQSNTAPKRAGAPAPKRAAPRKAGGRQRTAHTADDGEKY